MPPKKINNLDATLKRVTTKEGKKLISANLKESAKLSSGKFYTAYDPTSRQFIKGDLKDIAKALKTTPQTITKRFKSSESVFNRDVNGFIITRYNDLEKLSQYEKLIKSYDNKVKNVESAVLKKNNPEEYKKLLPADFKLKVKARTENKSFATNETQYKLDFGGSLTYEQIEGIFEKAIQKTIQKDNLSGDDKIRVILFDTNLQNPFSTPIMNVSEMNSSVVMDVVGKVENYMEDVIISEDTEIIIVTMKPSQEIKDKLQQKFKKQLYKGLTDTEIKINRSAKKSLVCINNTDDLCVPRAIATGLMMVLYGHNSTQYDNAKRGRKIQLEEAKKLVDDYESMTGNKYDGKGFSIDSLRIFEMLTDCQITAFDGGLNRVYPEFDEDYIPPDDESKTIYLYLADGHCDLINNTRVAGFLGSHYFCHKCKKTYSHKLEHKCAFKCNICCSGSCPWIELSQQSNKKNIVWIECDDCGRRFPCEECYNNHKKENSKGESVCSRMWKCPECKKLMSRETFPPETHVCGDFLCQNCKRVQPKEHQCYMKPKKLNYISEKYIFFDFESDISGSEHLVMYAVSMYFHDETPIIHNNIEEWCHWALSKENKNYTFIAHNGRGYDFRFIARWIFSNTKYKPFVIWGGEKIITMSIEELGIRFIDSLSFLTMPLKDFPKTFGLTELKKGFFPHHFNTKENWDYVGEMPNKELYFKPERMSVKDAKEFHKWYDKLVEEGYVWNQREEMKAYCISDVDILRRCCIQFRQLYLDIADIDPFTYLTIASVCMAIYRYWYIDETFPERHKKYENFKTTFAKGNPAQLKGEKLQIWNRFVEKYEKENYDNFMGEKKIAIFKYKDVEWMRQAFFGGRTNATKLIYNFKDGEEGIYSDITSLYPTVNYYDLYPKGHPIIIKEGEITDIHYKKILRKEYLGFFDIEVIPPTTLYHAVLPEKGEKLVFDLLPKRGIWCSNEVYVALDLGYKIKNVYEIRYFEEGSKTLFKGYVGKFLKIKQEASGFPKWVTEPENLKNNIPSGYERENIIAMEETARERLYIKIYEERQGILLDYNKISYNPGLRAIAKLSLNSLWGKFGQRTNMGHTVVLDNKEDYFDIIYNPRYENIQFLPLSDDKIEVSYTIKDEFVENDYSTNMAIACFTTSRARMRLYEEALLPLGRQVLYFDTDSVVYVYDINNPNHYRLENGDLLGEWTDELDGAKMVGTFVSGGPKNYSYELLHPNGETEYKTKVKGFTLNVETKEKINHNCIKDIIIKTLKDPMSMNAHKISVDWHGIKRAEDNTLKNITVQKRYGLCFTKREICDFDENGNVETLPFGYKDGIQRDMIELRDMEKEMKIFKSV